MLPSRFGFDGGCLELKDAKMLEEHIVPNTSTRKKALFSRIAPPGDKKASLIALVTDT